MKAGTVLFFKDFHFKDGGIKDKLIVIINTPTGNEPFLICITTSEQWRRKKILGCHPNYSYYYIDLKQDDFVKDTWILFDEIYEIDTATLLNNTFSGTLTELFDLEYTLWNAIKKCILIAQDVSGIHQEMVKNS